MRKKNVGDILQNYFESQHLNILEHLHQQDLNLQNHFKMLENIFSPDNDSEKIEKKLKIEKKNLESNINSENLKFKDKLEKQKAKTNNRLAGTNVYIPDNNNHSECIRNNRNRIRNERHNRINNNEERDKKKDLPYNLNINIYSNNSNNNLRNQTEQNYTNYYSLNNKYFNTNTKYKNLDDHLYYKQGSEKRKIESNLNKSKNQAMPKKIEVYTKNNGKENDLNKEKRNKKNIKAKTSLKSFEIRNSSKNKLNKNNRELMRICENDINSYRELEKKFNDYYKKRRAHSQTKYCLKKTSIPKKISNRFKFSSSCPRRKFIFLEKKSNEINGNISSPNIYNKSN